MNKTCSVNQNAQLTDLRDSFVQVCHKVYQTRLTVGTSGNISVRYNHTVLITASGLSLEEVTPANVMDVNLHDGRVMMADANGFQPSSEWLIHQAIYQARPDLNAVIHAHPPKSSALAVLHQTIETRYIAESILHFGQVPRVPYQRPGSPELAFAVAKAVVNGTSLILDNHGVIVSAPTLREAYYHLELLENMAEICLLVNGQPQSPCMLTDEQVQAILAEKAIASLVSSD